MKAISSDCDFLAYLSYLFRFLNNLESWKLESSRLIITVLVHLIIVLVVQIHRTQLFTNQHWREHNFIPLLVNKNVRTELSTRSPMSELNWIVVHGSTHELTDTRFISVVQCWHVAVKCRCDNTKSVWSSNTIHMFIHRQKQQKLLKNTQKYTCF